MVSDPKRCAIVCRRGETTSEAWRVELSLRSVGSVAADGHANLVEVKGRVAGADSVAVSKNEILTGLNIDRFCRLVEASLMAPTRRGLRRPVDGLGFCFLRCRRGHGIVAFECRSSRHRRPGRDDLLSRGQRAPVNPQAEARDQSR